MKNYSFPVEGMTCASCVSRVEKIIGKFDQISNVNVNLANENVTFQSDEDINFSAIASAVEEYGYKLIPKSKSQNPNSTHENLPTLDEPYVQLKKDFYLSLFFTIPLFLISMLMDFHFFHVIWPFGHDYTNKILLILATPIIFISGKRFFIIFYKNIKHFSFEMNSLVAIGTGAAYGYSLFASLFPKELSVNDIEPHVYFETAGVIITLILMGKLLEYKAKRKTNDAIKKLIELEPKTVRIILDGIENELSIDSLEKKNIVVIRPGEKIPADGIVISGSTSIDESMITGESIPVDKSIGSKVIGGTINKNGSVNFEVTEIGDNSILGQIIRLVEHAQASKPPIQKLADKIASVFVPVVIILALLTFILWLLLAPNNNFNAALINFIAVLIVACPCALGLATPTAIIVASGLGASNGILIKNGESLELSQKINTIVFDKTGTITEGKPSVSEITALNSSSQDILFYAASLESKSQHPLANAVTAKAQQMNIIPAEPESFQSLSGFGITGIVNGSNVIIGNLALLKQYSINTENYLEMYERLTSSGKTVVCISVDEILTGFISIEDKIKDSSAGAIDILKKMNIKTVMITGDNFRTASAIADLVGVDEFKAEVLPQGKADIIISYQKQNQVVAMVGDGINDAPALAQADIGIAVGTGTDVAIETAEITLVQGNLLSVSKAINLSKYTIKTIKQNLFWAFFYNIVLIPLAASGYLNPMIAALAMSLSSVSVISNSLRLKKTKI